jgi:hypothetical protein
MICTCGDDEDDHGNDDEYPGSTACNVDDCECIAFEAGEEDDDGEEA